METCCSHISSLALERTLREQGYQDAQMCHTEHGSKAGFHNTDYMNNSRRDPVNLVLGFLFPPSEIEIRGFNSGLVFLCQKQ